MKNSYTILGIPDFSELQIVKKAYRQLSRRYHPDGCINASEEEKEFNSNKFREISEAYAEISDEVKKAEYDRRLKASFSNNNSFERIFNSFFNENSFSFSSGWNQDLIKRDSQIRRKKDALEKELVSREREIRLKCIPKIAAMEKLENQLHQEIIQIHRDINDTKQQLMQNYQQLSNLYDKLLYKIIPSKYKNIEDKLKKEIEGLKSYADSLENKLYEKRKESHILKRKIICYESDTIDNDSEVIRIKKEINELEEQLENLYRGGKSR